VTRSTSGASLLVIAKEPLPGRAKTRLCPPLDAAWASAVASACLHDTLEVASTVEAARHVLVFDGDPGPWLRPGWDVVPQRGGPLGERLTNAFADVGGPAVIIAMDTPQLQSVSLTRALAAVTQPAVAVIGGSDDGGYWVLGLPGTDDPAAVFTDIPMSTSATGREQRQRLVDLGYQVIDLEVLRDIDRYDDLAPVASLIPQRRVGALVAFLQRSPEAPPLHLISPPDPSRRSDPSPTSRRLTQPGPIGRTP
jgi:glycosyltransferase A (GT-A) superfamily protein (DUF2064 family)